MPEDEYAPTVRGGLKLKGTNGPAGVAKKKKKKNKAPASTSKALEKAIEDQDDGKRIAEQDGAEKKRENVSGVDEEQEAEEGGQDMRELEQRDPHDGKTASERAYEETRRKRLQDRLLREGPPKTHKQRVEELNKYLSNLSEHHDMPRIGPG